MTTLFDFQFPESHKIIFCWDADVRPKSEIHPISDFKNFEFRVPLDMVLQATYDHLLVQACYSQFNQFSNSGQTGLASSNELLKCCRQFLFQYNRLLYCRVCVRSKAYTVLLARKRSHFSHDTSRTLILTESIDILSAAIQIRLLWYSNGQAVISDTLPKSNTRFG